ncbi:hypothetical protein PGT21_006031 [Puccinia graminis f. sp. tritici]|uniref:Rrn7/TAF1B N-terminal cyclin domain-containing protein n=1 Tax=Puccinia graminis f. sp. tritici TaxID=56615 RepID=A0A5B0PTJ9_PUCGR|nr:hypothetical protein PGTUg99_025564 [Puccinia graminis f. sp. tritici]KAA1103960.1 hypothetical protein PGT21_006031 [Puccinia graminis f. sp. tritici]
MSQSAFSQSQQTQRSRQQSIFSQTASQSTTRSTTTSKAHHPTCPRCGSRKWRRDPNRGVVVCAEGHVLEGFLRESTEQTEASQYSLRKRRLSAAPRQRKSYIGKSAYQDQRARILLVQALTLLIRKQIEALVQIINAPTQLEEITQTLWKAYLSAINLDDNLFRAEDRSPSPAIPSSRFGDDSQSAGYSSQDPDSSQHTTTPRRTNPSTSDSLLQTGATPNKDQLTTPEALKAITQNHPESSDDSSTDSASSSSSSHGLQQKKSTRKTPKTHHRTHTENIKIHPRMVVTICTIYLACLKLRLPIILQDLINFITTKQVPHIGFIHSIPTEVQKKMNRPVMQSLSAEKPPRLFARRGHSSGLVNVCRQLLKIFQDANPSVLLPENTAPNLSLLVLRFSKVLLLPDPLQLVALNLVRRLDPYFLTLSVLPPCGGAQTSMGAVSAKTTTSAADRRGGSATGNKALAIFRMQMAKYPPEWFIMAVVYIVAQSAIVASCSNCPRPSAASSSSDNDDDNNDGDYENDKDGDGDDDGGGRAAGAGGEGGGANSVADQNQGEIDQQMRRLVSQFLPHHDQWYQDLTHKIKLDEDQKPQTLWEKNLTELDPKEIDAYIAFTKDFLLNDQPEPNDISFKNLFFPLSSTTRTEANGDIEMDEAGSNERAREGGGINGRSTNLQEVPSEPTEDQSADTHPQNRLKRKDDQQEIVKLLTQLLVTRSSESVGCTLSNHSHLEEFVKVYVFVDSFLSKKI